MKLMVDQRGVTIASDKYQVTAAGTATESGALEPDDIMFGVAESTQMETIIAELETVSRRAYGQYCGLARAMEVVGERWALLIVRDLLVSPKHRVDLQVGLPRIPAEILESRLRGLERAGVVRRMTDDAPDTAYELTEYGKELDEIVLAMGRWGARQLGEPRPEEIVTVDSLTMALRATFQRQAAQGVNATFEVTLGEIVLNLAVADGTLSVSRGPLPDADLSFDPGMTLKDLMSGAVTVEQVVESGDVSFEGDPKLLHLFARLFRIEGGTD